MKKTAVLCAALALTGLATPAHAVALDPVDALLATDEIDPYLTTAQRRTLAWASRVDLPPRYEASLVDSIIDGVTVAVARDARLPRGSFDLARAAVQVDVLANLDPTAMTLAAIADQRCGSSDCLDDANDVLVGSALIREEVARWGLDSYDEWVHAQPSAIEAIAQAAWTANAEREFRDALELSFEDGVTSDEIETILEESAASGGIPYAMLAEFESGALTMPAPGTMGATCSNSTEGESHGPFGSCGVPGFGPPPPGDPSPLGYSSFDGPLGGPSLDDLGPPPSWSMPGACFGLDPMAMFGAGTVDDPPAGDDDDFVGPPEPSVLVVDDPPAAEPVDTGADLPDPTVDDSPSLEDQVNDLVNVDLGGGVTFDTVDSLSGTYDNLSSGTWGPSFSLRFMPNPMSEVPVTASDCGGSLAQSLLGCMFPDSDSNGDGVGVLCDSDLPPTGPFDIAGPDDGMCGCITSDGSACATSGLASELAEFGSGGGDGISGMSSSAWVTEDSGTGSSCTNSGSDDACPVSCLMEVIAASAAGPEMAIDPGFLDECGGCDGGAGSDSSVYEELCASEFAYAIPACGVIDPAPWSGGQ